ncbi:NPFF2 protein, partial [Polypterus senegalus]
MKKIKSAHFDLRQKRSQRLKGRHSYATLAARLLLGRRPLCTHAHDIKSLSALWRLTLDIRRNILSYVLNDWDRFKVWTDDGTGDNYTTQEHYKSEMPKPFTCGSACWPFGSMVCKMSGMVQGISVSASVFTLVAIAVDRFRCIVYPFKQKLTISTAVLIIVVIWVLAISIMCPSGVMLQVTEEKSLRVILGDDNKTNPFYWCRENWPNQEMRKIYTTVLFANIYLAPLSLIVIMYARIGITLFKTSMPIGGKTGHENQQTVSKKKQKVIKMLLIVALLFILSWLPLWTLMMLSDYANLSEHQYRVINIYIYPFAHWLAFFNSSVNPIIYGYFNENFRRGFQAAFKFQLCSAEMVRREAYSHRVQGNAVLPAGIQVVQELPSRHNRAEGNCSQTNSNANEQDLIMEDLEKISNNNGIQKESY